MTAKLNCAETFQRLDDYLDRELSAEDAAAVQAHLENCAECTGEFEVERDLLATIRAKLVSVPVPGGLMERISKRLRRG